MTTPTPHGFHIEAFDFPDTPESRRALQLQLTATMGQQGWAIAAAAAFTRNAREQLLIIFQLPAHPAPTHPVPTP